MSTSASATSVQIDNISKQNGKLFMQIGIAKKNQDSYQWLHSASDASNSNIEVQLDTGSCGIVIPAKFLYEPGTYNAPVDASQPVGTLRSGVSGPYKAIHLTYQPSNDHLDGFLYKIEMLGLGADANGEPIAIAQNVSVIGATNCTPHMMGIGFDRNILADNAFLNPLVSASNGQPLNWSYYLDHEKIILGAVPNSSFVFQQLSAKPSAQEIANVGTNTFTGLSSLKGKLLVTDANHSTLLGPLDVSLLIDTGLDLMMVNHIDAFPVPTKSTPPTPWSNASITISFNANADTVPSYQFALDGTGIADFSKSMQNVPVFTVQGIPAVNGKVPVGDNSQKRTASPTLVHVIQASNQSAQPNQPFINTGFNPLFQFGMLVDASNTRVGFGQLP